MSIPFVSAFLFLFLFLSAFTHRPSTVNQDIAAISKNILANEPSSDEDEDEEDEDEDDNDSDHPNQPNRLINAFLDAQLNKNSQALLPSSTLPGPVSSPAFSSPNPTNDAHHPIVLQSASSQIAPPLPSGSPTPTASRERIDEQDLSRLIHSLLHSASHLPPTLNPTPEPPSSPPALSPLILSGAPIDPLLESLAPSPPTTLSAPHSPQPVFRPGHSPSQQRAISSALPPPRQPVLRQDASTSRQRLSDAVSSQPTAAPPLMTTCSLEQLANPPPGQQPNYPWWTIIRAAIMGSRYGMMTRDEICDALAARWTYFRYTDEKATRIWKSAVGHNLSVKECFLRVYVEGEGNVSYYIVDTAVDPAKGRLSKNKAASSNERIPIPTISRRPVLPSTLNLSAQARWSPAIAAIRNAQHGLPPAAPRAASIAADEHSYSESDSDDAESDSEASTETDTCAVPGSRLGSSLSAIIGDAAPNRLPRLAFSRSLTNALVNSQAPSRRTAAHARTPDRRAPRPARQRPSASKARSQPFAQRPPPIIRPRVVPVQERLLPPRPPSPQAPSLQQQVAAALADVAAKLPALVTDGQQQRTPDRPARPALTDPPLPTFNIDNLLKEVQAEFATQESSGSEDSSSSEEDTEESGSETGLGGESVAPTAADFDRLLASVVGGVAGVGRTDDRLSRGKDDEEGGDSRRSKRSAEDAGLGNLLQSLIDEATQTGAAGNAEEGCSDSESDASEQAVSGATRMLDAEIAAALEQATVAARLSTSLAGVVELTASGDIPVHPLPAESGQVVPVAPRAAHAVARARNAAPRASPRRAARGASLAGAASDAGSVDRRTRASGTRPLGRRLNLPLPSSHTGVDERVDDTALAPSLLESIQVVTTERPRATYPELAKEAILTHPGGKMTAAEIFKVVEKKYPFFVNRPDSWKATLRNVLTSHSCFVKIPRPADAPGRGDWWATVDLPLWKKRRTTAKAKMEQDFLGRHAREQLSKARGGGGRRTVDSDGGVGTGTVLEAVTRVPQVETETRAPQVGTEAGDVEVAVRVDEEMRVEDARAEEEIRVVGDLGTDAGAEDVSMHNITCGVGS